MRDEKWNWLPPPQQHFINDHDYDCSKCFEIEVLDFLFEIKILFLQLEKIEDSGLQTKDKEAFINSRTAIAGAIIGLLLVFFITIQRIWIVLGRCLFFKICSHIFMIFEVKLE